MPCTKEQFYDLRRRGSTTLLSPTDIEPITPGGSDYAFGVAVALQCATGGAITVITVGGDSVTVTLADGARLDVPTTRCTAFAGTGLFAYIPAL